MVNKYNINNYITEAKQMAKKRDKGLISTLELHKWMKESSQKLKRKDFAEGETLQDRLKKIASSNISTEEDEKVILYLARMMKLDKAIVTTGLIYPEGYGPPIDIHSFAKMVLEKLK